MNFRKIFFWITLFFSVSLVSFSILVRDLSTTLNVSLQAELPSSSVFQIFWVDWKAGPMGYGPNQSVFLDIKNGKGEFSFHIPADYTMLRLDPASTTGKIIFSKIEIKRYFVKLKSWGSAQGFSGWSPLNDIASFKTTNGKLEMTSSGKDPYFENVDLDGIGFRRKLADIFISTLCGVFGVLFFILIFKLYNLFVFRDLKQSKKSTTVSFDTKNLALFLGSLIICLVVVVFAYRRLFKVVEVQPVWNDYCGPYLVDHNGNNLSVLKNGRAIKFILDPFTLFRNYPGQNSKGFTTNSEGFRDGLDLKGAREKGMLLGGSSAFSCGAISDSSALHGQLSQEMPMFHFINGGVVGYLSGQELGQMIFYADKHNPKIYIVLNGFNDVYTSKVTIEKSFGQNIAFGSNVNVIQQIENRLRGSDPEVSDWKFSSFEKMDSQDAFKRGFEAYQKNIILMSEFAARRGAKFFHFYQPLASARLNKELKGIWDNKDPQIGLNSAEFNVLYNKFYEDLLPVFEKNGIVSVNLNLNSKILSYPEPIFIDLMHLNDIGLKVIAEEISKVVQSKTKKIQ